MAITDLDLDGRLDILTANYASSSVTILRGEGRRGFKLHGHCQIHRYADAVAVGDMNGDGRPDIVVGSSAGVEILFALTR